MYNDLFSIGNLTVHGYGLMFGLGIITAYLMVEYAAKKRGIHPDKTMNMAIASVVSGMVGSKLLFLITKLPEIINDPSVISGFLRNGFVVYGGILGGVLGAFLYCRHSGLNFLQMLDLTVPGLACAQGLGRIGCLLAGCCYGMEVDAANPLAIVFTHSDYAPNNVPLLPTQIISSILDFAHFLLLLFLSKRLKKHGQLGGVYFICYAIGRFVLEFFRGDLIRGSVGTISTSQFISLFVVVLGLVMFFVIARQDKTEEMPASME